MKKALEEKSKEIEEMSRITVGDLRGQLSVFADDAELVFGSTMAGDTLIFYRTKRLGDDMVLIELNELTEESLKESIKADAKKKKS